MNRFLSILFLILTVTNAVFSQDLLLFENGEKKEVKILEINPSDIKYKKFSSSNEVIYTEDKSNLIGVIYEGGEFEKFEKNNKRREDSSPSITERNSNYGSNMFYVGPLDLLYGTMLNIGYEHFTESGRASIRIPLRVQLGDSYTDFIGGAEIYDFWKIGFEHKFFPTGSDGIVKGFLGYGVHFGGYAYPYEYNTYYYYYNSYKRDVSFFNVQFMGGIQFQPTELINLTMDIGIGPAVEEDDDVVLWPSFSTTLGFRF